MSERTKIIDDQAASSHIEKPMPPTICLNMIVRDEAEVIRRCLSSALPIIDSWVIVDTGSRDETKTLVRTLLRDIPGELHERPWKDFGFNRSEAIELAKGRGDYLLFLDADDELVVEPGFDKSALSAAAYRLRFRHQENSFWRPALVSTKKHWRFVGVLHEYLECEEAPQYENLTTLRIEERREGARSRNATQEEKYSRDAVILERALRDDPKNARYAFYLAQSYRDSFQYEKAIAVYQRRLEMGGWEEELWHATYQIARIREQLKSEPATVVAGYLQAYAMRSSRAEPLVDLARWYRERQQWPLAKLFAKRAIELKMPDDILFVDAATYGWRALDEYAVACYWTGDYAISAAVGEKLLVNPAVPFEQLPRLTANVNFALSKLKKPLIRPLLPFAVTETPGAANSSTQRSLFKLPDRAIQVVDVGAAFLGEDVPYKALLDNKLCEVWAFEPDPSEYERAKNHLAGKGNVVQAALGDGNEHTLYICGEGLGMSSLLEPDPATLGYFNLFPEWGRRRPFGSFIHHSL